MTATVLIDFSEVKGALPEMVIDSIAVFADEEGRSCVWVVDTKTNKVHKRIVVTGELTGKDKIKIKKGLSVGDMIAASGVSSLREGMTVRRFETGNFGE